MSETIRHMDDGFAENQKLKAEIADLEAELRRGIACVDGDHDLHHAKMCKPCHDKQVADLEAERDVYKQKCLDYIDWCDARDKRRAELEAQVADNKMTGHILEECEWQKDDDEFWWTDCKNGFVFNDGGTPLEHSFKHCPYCGGKLKEYKRDSVTS